MPDLSHICDLHHSSWQYQLLNPLNEAKDQTCNFMDTNQIHFRWAMMGTLYLESWFLSSDLQTCVVSRYDSADKRVLFFSSISFFFLGLHLCHMEDCRLGVESAMLDLSCVCDLCSLQQCWILNRLTKVRDWTWILTDICCVLNPLSHNRNSLKECFWFVRA